VLGALVLEPAQLYLTLQFTNGYLSEILLGLLLLVVLRFLPRGVLPAGGELLTRARARGGGP
jgi:ABC-type branched-subunit amino acid transport system permease subunit